MPNPPYPTPHPPAAGPETAVAKFLDDQGVDQRLYFQKGLENVTSKSGQPLGYATDDAFNKLVSALNTHETADFNAILLHDSSDGRPLVNPQAGLASDSAAPSPWLFKIPPPPEQNEQMTTTAAEIIELYWMAHLREVGFSDFKNGGDVDAAIEELKELDLYPEGDPNNPTFGALGDGLNTQNLFR
ncbi:hypothetical protein N9Z02_02800, partial [Akkermansiaceae bacterium]|nr:hypothetical protein [Akkermansiaceae bacterium]